MKDEHLRVAVKGALTAIVDHTNRGSCAFACVIDGEWKQMDWELVCEEIIEMYEKVTGEEFK